MDLRSWTGGRGRRFLFYVLALLSLSRSAAAGVYEPDQKLYVASSEESRASAAQDAGHEDERPAPSEVAASQPQTDSLPVYTPPRRATPRALVGGGVRLSRGLPAPLALVPAHLAQTLSPAPSLFWYVSAAPPAGAHATLTIASEDAIEPLAEVTLPLPRSAGIQRVRLDDFGIVLEPGVEYEWAIALGEDADGSARDQVATGYITRVPEPAELAARGRSAASLAALGLWYDALAAVSDEVEARPSDPRPRAARSALLRQAELNEAAD